MMELCFPSQVEQLLGSTTCCIGQVSGTFVSHAFIQTNQLFYQSLCTGVTGCFHERASTQVTLNFTAVASAVGIQGPHPGGSFFSEMEASEECAMIWHEARTFPFNDTTLGEKMPLQTSIPRNGLYRV